jgi:hypothetical protein
MGLIMPALGALDTNNGKGRRNLLLDNRHLFPFLYQLIVFWFSLLRISTRDAFK